MEQEDKDFYSVEKEFNSLIPSDWEYKASLMFSDWEEIKGYMDAFNSKRELPENAEIYEDTYRNKIIKVQYDDLDVYLKGVLDGPDTMIRAIVKGESTLFAMTLFSFKGHGISNIKRTYGNSKLEAVLQKTFLNNKKEQD